MNLDFLVVIFRENIRIFFVSEIFCMTFELCFFNESHRRAFIMKLSKIEILYDNLCSLRHKLIFKTFQNIAKKIFYWIFFEVL